MNIDKLILKSLNKSASLEEFEILEKWKNESSENLEFLNMMQSNNKIPYKDFGTQKAWSKISAQLKLNSTFNYLKYAALILLLSGLTYYAYTSNIKNESVPEMLTNENMQHFVLIDDSDVWLNHHSELLMKSDFTRERKVSLKGEAYFDVEADKNNPFIIELEGDNFIKVIGTSFNVINRPDKFDLTVYSGTVEFHALKRVIVLEKGERITSINGTYTKIRNQDLNTLSWKTKELVFDNSPLLKAFSELENHYNVKFEINPDLDLTSCKLRSKFNDETLGQVLNELKLIFNMEYFETDTHVQIQQLNCN